MNFFLEIPWKRLDERTTSDIWFSTRGISPIFCYFGYTWGYFWKLQSYLFCTTEFLKGYIRYKVLVFANRADIIYFLFLQLVDELLENLSVDTFNVVISSKRFKELSKEEKEPWFKTQYSIKGSFACWLFFVYNDGFHNPYDKQYLNQKVILYKNSNVQMSSQVLLILSVILRMQIWTR
jgi:hypothetical protein